MYDLILEKLWLAKHNPEIDWKENLLTFDFNRKQIQWTANADTKLKTLLLSAMQLKKAKKKKEKMIYLVYLTANPVLETLTKKPRTILLKKFSNCIQTFS